VSTFYGYDAQGVRQERTGWRDQQISERHRHWGFNCPAVDLDFVMAEYNNAKPVALVEYKHFNAIGNIKLQHATFRTLKDLADGYENNGIPFFVAVYWPGSWAFRVVPVNEKAREIFPEGYTDLTEREFVSALYYMRGKCLESEGNHVLEKLRDDKPPLEATA